jgi:hypothetical protein
MGYWVYVVQSSSFVRTNSLGSSRLLALGCDFETFKDFFAEYPDHVSGYSNPCSAVWAVSVKYLPIIV